MLAYAHRQFHDATLGAPMEHAAHILFVDDEPGSREGLTLLLQHEGYHVDAASDGEMALRLFSKKTYDVVIVGVLKNLCQHWR